MNLNKLLPCLAASLLLTACGSSSNSDKNVGQADKGAGLEEKGAGLEDSLDQIYLVKSTSWTTDDGIALHFITDTLNAETVFDKSEALAIPGYTGIAVPEGDNPDNAFFVGLNPEPIFQRYVVSDAGEVTLDKSIDFTNTGAGSSGRALMRASKILSPSKGYIVDANTLQIIVFNPTAMTITNTISLADLAETNLPNRWSIFPVIDGDRFIAAISYYDADWDAVAHTKVVIVDSNTDTFITDTSTDCGSVSSSAKDAAGNIYFASHDQTALEYFKGTGAYPPCAIRINAGANEWDDTYLLHLQNLTNDNRLAMTAMTGPGDTAYTLVLSSTAQAQLTSETHFKSLIQNIWEFHSFDLTDDSAVATKIDYEPMTVSRVQYGSFAHDELGDISWMFRVSDDFGMSTIINSTNPANWSDITTVPGQLELVTRLK
jgi:hypothetical protein